MIGRLRVCITLASRVICFAPRGFVLQFSLFIKNQQLGFTEDSAGRGRIESLYSWYTCLSQEGKKYRHHMNGAKRLLIVKSYELADKRADGVWNQGNITTYALQTELTELLATAGKRHLGASIRFKNYKYLYFHAYGKIQG